MLLFPHINPDPDAIGSCMALCRALRQQGKEAQILLDYPLPQYLQFMMPWAEDETANAADTADTAEEPGRSRCSFFATLDDDVIEEPDICMLVDCSEDNRFTGREEAFFGGKKTLCLDHHQVSECHYDRYHIDPDAAATAQLVFLMAQEMDWPIDRAMAEMIYTGICGDTGCFMHSNTTPQIHRIAADLQEIGVDANYINVRLYQSKDLRAVKLSAKAMQQMELLADGRAVMSRLTAEDFKECDAIVDHADTVIDDLRSIDGVEIAAFLKQDGKKTRCNLRSKTDANVADIAMRFGGGGHIKAAGFKTDQPLEEVYEKLREEILRVLG